MPNGKHIVRAYSHKSCKSYILLSRLSRNLWLRLTRMIRVSFKETKAYLKWIVFMEFMELFQFVTWRWRIFPMLKVTNNMTDHFNCDRSFQASTCFLSRNQSFEVVSHWLRAMCQFPLLLDVFLAQFSLSASCESRAFNFLMNTTSPVETCIFPIEVGCSIAIICGAGAGGWMTSWVSCIRSSVVM